MKSVKTPCCEHEYIPHHGYSPIRHDAGTGKVICYWCGCRFNPVPDSVAVSKFTALAEFFRYKKGLTDSADSGIVGGA